MTTDLHNLNRHYYEIKEKMNTPEYSMNLAEIFPLLFLSLIFKQLKMGKSKKQSNIIDGRIYNSD